MERIRTSQFETADFLRKVGCLVNPERIIEVFPGYFPERRVLRVKSGEGCDSRVLKVRPLNADAIIEVDKLQQLLGAEKFLGAHGCSVRVDRIEATKYLVMRMPYLGVDLTKLAQLLDLEELGYIDGNEDRFEGFNSPHIKRLINVLRNGHLAFARKHGLIHGDMFQNRGPNNIVYDKGSDRLFLVDAEALAICNDERSVRFMEQLDKVEEWMCMNLLAT